MPGASRRQAADRRLSARSLNANNIRIWQIALAVLAGNVLLHQMAELPAHAILVALALGALAAIRWLALPAIMVLAFCWTGIVAERELDARWPPSADGVDVSLTGWIDDLPQRDAGRTVFSLRVVDALHPGAPRRVRLSWYDPAPPLAAGQTLAIEARLRSPRGLVNPGGFDFERWLFVEGYDATGYVRRGRVESARRFSLAQRWLEVRSAIAERITQRVSDPDAAALIRALALGERSRFEDRHWTVLQRTGTSHLVAVSGLHIGMIAALSYWLILRLALRLPPALAQRAHSLAALFSLLPATVYAALAGFTLPTRRALIMLLVVQALVVSRRRTPLAGSLALALIVILLTDALATLTASFWLSFGAVALLLSASATATQPLHAVRPGRLAGLSEFCRLQFALTLGLIPLVLWFFGQLSLISFAVNLIAIPAFGLAVVPLALACALTAALGIDPFGLLVSVAGTAAELAWRLLELAAGLDFAAFAVARPRLSALLLGIVAVALCVPRHRLPGRRLGAFALLPLIVGHGTGPAPGLAKATVLDVGHGLAVAIDTATHRVLYDAGPLFRSGFDAGAEVVAPALEAIGRRPLNLLILSHGDSDHAGGARSILARYPSAKVLASPDVDMPEAERCIAGQSWRFDDVRFSVLHPPQQSAFTGNDSSCVILVETLTGTLLLTGDIEAPAEALLIGSARMQADVVIVPHHGSMTSSTRAFVSAVRPRVAIVSAAHNNRWNFPRPEVTQRWQSVGATVLATGDHGAIEISFGPEGIALGTLRHVRRRYWQASPPRLVSGDFDPTAL